MRKKLFALNTITSIFYQIVVVICGFVLPRVILLKCGSDVNGLVNSISQFLFVIQYLELGVGAAATSALYKPLAERDSDRINKIVTSATRFFKKVGMVLCLYVAILVIFYPRFNDLFDYWYVATLILILSINYFSQYYFGIVDNIIIGADQRSYIQYTVQIGTQILNTISCVILLNLGFGIHAVKLTTAVIFLVRPIFVRKYINNHFCLNRKTKYDKEPIQQKWNAVAQHLSECILDSTDTIILTIFSTFSQISIYSVYNSVAFGIKQFFMSATNGTLSLIGDIWARNEKDELKKIYLWNEWITHTCVVVAFGCTASLITPFVMLYTSNINDANYIQPVFGVILCLAHASHCLRLPYFTLIKAAGHYKETQWNFIVSSLINILISIILVNKLGLIGVAIGTLVSMMFQTIWMAFYCSEKLIKLSFLKFIKQIIVDIISIILLLIINQYFSYKTISVLAWIQKAIITVLFTSLIVLIINLVFYNNYISKIFEKIRISLKRVIK